MPKKIENISPQIKAVLFDLDGTLLPMKQDDFVKAYFGGLAKKAESYGYAPKEIIDVIWRGTGAMIKNDGEKPNEQIFWEYFVSVYGEKANTDKKMFDEFYANDFYRVKEACGFNPECAEMVYDLKARGYRIVLATNPLFPSVATEARIRWAGLEPEDFEFYTTYENSRYCKPNVKYYIDIINRLGLKAEECMMVGNDIDEDIIPALSLGMEVHLLTDCLINKSGTDIEKLFAEKKSN